MPANIIALYDEQPAARAETTFERANRIAAERKAAAWAAYVPLERGAFIDDWNHPHKVTIRIFDKDTGTRSTFAQSQIQPTGQVIARPTELAATAAAYAGNASEDLIVLRLEPEGHDKKRKCSRCSRLMVLARFDRDRRTVSGWAFYCHECREQLRIQHGKRVA